MKSEYDISEFKVIIAGKECKGALMINQKESLQEAIDKFNESIERELLELVKDHMHETEKYCLYPQGMEMYFGTIEGGLENATKLKTKLIFN